MYVGYLSWRYLLRRRINSIGIMGITVGVGALIMILSIMSGFLEESRKTVRGSISDVIVQPSDYLRLDGSRPTKESEPLVAKLLEHEAVEGACARLAWGGIVIQSGSAGFESVKKLKDAQGKNLAFASFVGVDVEDEFNTTRFRESLSQPGRWGSQVEDIDNPFAEPKGYDGDEPWDWIVVGEQLAAYRGLHQGSVINLITVVPNPLTDEAVTCNRKFLVAGTFRTGDNEIDLSHIYVDRPALSDFLAGTHEFTQVLVKLKDYEKHGSTIDGELSEILATANLISNPDPDYYEVRTWEDFRAPLLGAIQNERVLMGIMLALIVLVAAFTVFAILMMMVSEKRRDIGILAALGATPRSIMWIFLWIGMWNAVLGCIFGSILGIAGALNIDNIERWLSSTFNVQIFNREVYFFDHIPAVVSPMAVASIIVGALLATALFSLFPALVASRLHPIDALRAE